MPNSDNNHWGTNILNSRLIELAHSYNEEYATGPILAFNDMSLPSGGKFDIAGKWIRYRSDGRETGHIRHREGLNVDMRTDRLGVLPPEGSGPNPGAGASGTKRHWLWNEISRIFDDHPPHEENLGSSTWHWHLTVENSSLNKETPMNNQNLMLATMTFLSFHPKINGNEKSPFEIENPTAKVIYVKPNNLTLNALPKINLSNVSKLFTYVYTVENSKKSEQTLLNFYIHCPFPFFSVKSPNGWRPWLGKFRSVEDYKKSLVRRRNTLDWAGVGNRIVPGEKTEGFGFESALLPGIVPFYGEGYAPVLQIIWPKNIELEQEEAGGCYAPDPDSLHPKGWHFLDDAFKGETVGPDDSVNDFSPVSLIERLLTLIDLGQKKKWIERGQGFNFINKKLQEIKNLVQSGKTKESIGSLTKLSSQVKNGDVQPFSQKAISLICPNLEFIILKLEEFK